MGMADEEPISDASIERMVEIVKAAEVYAAAMGCSVSDGIRQLLKSSQVFTQMKKGQAKQGFPSNLSSIDFTRVQ